MTKEYSLNIFDVLKNIDKKNIEFFDSLTEEQRKDIKPFVLMRWLTGSNDPARIMKLNMAVNPYVFQLQNEHELMLRLLFACTDKKTQRYKYIKAQGRTSGFPNTLSVIKEYYKYNNKEAKEALPLLTNDDILEYAAYLGRQKEDIDKIKKELNAR